MFSWNDEQNNRQVNYDRYRKLTAFGHSIAEEFSEQSSLYAVSTDVFGRSYYLKPIGEIVQTDEKGRTYTTEGWAVKDFIVDNKIQLINKVSSDLLVGVPPDITLKDAADKENDWLTDLLVELHYSTKLIEGALAVSALGDRFMLPTVRNGTLKLFSAEPDYFDIRFNEDGEPDCVVHAWELENVETGIKKVDKYVKRQSKKEGIEARTKLLRVKEYYKGRIDHSLYMVKLGEIAAPVTLANIEPQLFTQAKGQNNRIVFKKEVVEGVDKALYLHTISEFTGIDEFLAQHWPNYKLLKPWWGQSDNGMVESLQNALNSRQTQLNDILDKHSDPAMYGPGGFLDEQGRLKMSGGGGRYFPVDKDDEKPGYLTWEGHISDSHDELKRIYKAICDNTETSPALTGMDVGGIESGRALMYRLIRSLAMKARKGTYLVDTIKTNVLTLQKLKIIYIDGKEEDVTEEPRTEWDDVVFPVEVKLKENLPTDVGENLKNIGYIVAAGLMSHKTGVKLVAKYFEEIDPGDELKAIAEETLKQLTDKWKILGAGTGEAGE